MMVQYTLPLDTKSLLPPFLAFLPTASVSPRAPPALLPLLSPILRQRLTFNTDASPESPSSWLSLLCWESQAASKLVTIVTRSTAFEPHPSSGEVDYGHLEPIRYRRRDEETLQGQVVIPDLKLAVTYLWCQDDAAGGGSGWRVSEVRPAEKGDLQNADKDWVSSVAEADFKTKEKALTAALQNGQRNSLAPDFNQTASSPGSTYDDDYWAKYDFTPGPKSARSKPSPYPSVTSASIGQSVSEADYFGRYSSVQADMDSESPETDKSFDNQPARKSSDSGSGRRPQLSSGRSQRMTKTRLPTTVPEDQMAPPVAPVKSPSLRSNSNSTSDMAIKQHVSTTIKGLFRLCQNTGMDYAEFENVIHRELVSLSVIANEDQ